ncbi:MAG TPA: carboxypeptidase regulatory-like domain-containing protein [Planctomycetes bacterium]|nr:carboxypeptidase regulatory-like domain-containing protein [Planctomycetota bacterium]
MFKFAAMNGKNQGITRTKSIKIGPGETKRVVFRLDTGKGPAGTIHGTIRLGGRPAPGYTVTVESGEKSRSARSGPDGTYTVTRIPPGPLDIQVRCQDSGFEGVSRALSRKKIDLPPGGNYRVDFDLQVGSIEGKVLLPSGRPLGGVMVEARWKGGGENPTSSRRVQAIAGTDGTFTLGNVPLGSWEVAIRSQNFKSARKARVEITGPGVVARVTLRALSTVSFTVLLDPPLAKGEFYQGYRLVPRGGPLEIPLSGFPWARENSIHLQAPPGNYTLGMWIWGKGGKKWVARGRLTVPEKPKDPILVLLGPREDPARNIVKYPVAGKLFGKDGRPSGPGQIHFNSTRDGNTGLSFMGGLAFKIGVSKDGTFRGELPKGDFTWWAVVRKGKRREFLSSRSKRVHIPAGGVTDLALR